MRRITCNLRSIAAAARHRNVGMFQPLVSMEKLDGIAGGTDGGEPKGGQI
jgi:hypothetical protein